MQQVIVILEHLDHVFPFSRSLCICWWDSLGSVKECINHWLNFNQGTCPCVGFWYTLTCTWPWTLEVDVSRNESLLSSTISFVNWMLGLMELRWSWNSCTWIFEANMAVINVPIPPFWRMSCGGHCSCLYVLHHQVSDSRTHGRPHGTTNCLLVMFLFISEKNYSSRQTLEVAWCLVQKCLSVLLE